MPTNDYCIPHFEPTEFDTHISSYTQLLGGSSNYCEMTPQLNEPSHLNVNPTTDILVAKSKSNKMSHDYHAQNGLSHCHTLVSSEDHPLLGCDPRLTTSRHAGSQNKAL